MSPRMKAFDFFYEVPGSANGSVGAKSDRRPLLCQSTSFLKGIQGARPYAVWAFGKPPARARTQ